MDYLPIFMKIEQQHCLIVGGGAVAARKADLFIKSGAIVTVVAPKLGNEMTFHLTQGKIIWHMNTFSTALLSELPRPSLVISATDDQNVNLAVYETYRAQSIPVNVADQTDYCDFILPAIVDRSPMTIAISTAGRSPVLARYMKARLESLIPHSLAKVGDILGRYRQVIKDRVKDPEGRRYFWENLLNSGTFLNRVSKDQIEEACHYLEEQMAITSQEDYQPVGEVYLIGAGPGDPELMTLKAHRLLQEADVVVYDRLVSEEILDMARREAERIYVGKRSRWHKVPQPKINELLLRLAQEGKKVARLKGGDPFIFGRGAEELELLTEHGVCYQVVPGITAAAGCAASCDFPLTHRDYSQSVSFVTGHQQAGAEKIDYARLAQSGDTMVFYMGVKNSAEIQKGLLAQGINPNIPAAIIENGTRSNQKITITTLERLSKTIQAHQVKPPSLLVIGEVLKVREKLQQNLKSISKRATLLEVVAV